MDKDPGWRSLESGELLHVGAELEISSAVVLPNPPTHSLDLGEHGRIPETVGHRGE